MSKIILFVFLLVSSVSAWAQPDVAPKKIHNMKMCYEHTVAKGQTAYGIAKMYSVSVTELFEDNPEAANGLSIGQILYIDAHDVSVPPVSIAKDSVKVVPPQESLQTEETKDSSVLIHTVLAGETYYAIAKKYSVKLEDLMAANKDKVTLKVGDTIIIPVEKANKNNEIQPLVKDPINTSVNPGDSVILHKVQAGNTFYSLQQEYGVSEAQIRAANDGLPQGLKKGEVIKIVVKKKNVTAHEEKPPVTYVKDTTSRIEQTYDVAIMLPFMLDANDNFRAKCPPVGDCPFYGYTLMSLNFERGIMMAVDSLRKAGLSVNVYVYDTENDTASVRKILSKPEMANIDLIFGPLYPQQIKIVSEYAKAHKIQNVIPVPVSNKALFNNPYVSKYVASTPTQIQYMGAYIAKTFPNDNVIAIKNTGKKQDGYYFDEFVESYNRNIKNQSVRSQDSAKTAMMGAASKLTAVEGMLSATKKNILVVPAEDLGHVSNFITKLSGTTNKNPYSKYEFIVFGLEDWVNYETIDEKYKNRYNLHVVTAGYVDFESQEVKDFILDFRIKYGIDPDKYALNGFDAAFTNLKGLMLYGSGYANNYGLLNTDGFSSGSDYNTVEQGSGYENQSIQILRYNNYTIEVIKD